MQSLKGNSAREGNLVLSRTGQFWEHESFDHVISKGRFRATIRYVLNNPVKAGLATTAEIYPYSSMGEYMGLRPPEIIAHRQVVKLIGSAAKSLENYRKFVNAGIDLNLEKYDPFLSAHDVLGGAIFATHRKVAGNRRYK